MRMAWGMSFSSGAEDCTRRDAGTLRPFRYGDLLGVFGLHLAHLDLAALRGDAHRLGADVGDLADLAFHRAESAHDVLARAEELHFFAADRGPRAGRRIAAADGVVDEVDVVVPAHLRLVGAAPAFIGGLRLVLHRFLVLAGYDEIGGLEH